MTSNTIRCTAVTLVAMLWLTIPARGDGKLSGLDEHIKSLSTASVPKIRESLEPLLDGIDDAMAIAMAEHPNPNMKIFVVTSLEQHTSLEDVHKETRKKIRVSDQAAKRIRTSLLQDSDDMVRHYAFFCWLVANDLTPRKRYTHSNENGFLLTGAARETLSNLSQDEIRMLVTRLENSESARLDLFPGVFKVTPAVQDQDVEWVLVHAGKNLGHFFEDALMHPKQNLRGKIKEIVRQRNEIHSKSIPMLIQRLDDPDEELRVSAAWALGLAKDQSDIVSRSLARHRQVGHVAKTSAMLSEVINSLGKLSSATQDNTSYLIEVIHDQHSHARSVALSHLIRLAKTDDSLVAELIELLSSKRPHVVENAMHSLSYVGHRAASAIPKIKEILSHNETPSVAACLWRLERRPESVLPCYLAALNGQDEKKKAGAFACLREMGPAASPALPYYLERLASSSSEDKETAVKGLRALEGAASPAIPQYIAELNSKDPIDKKRALLGLIALGPKASPAVDAILPLLSEEKSVAIAAARTLGKIGPAAKAALPHLEQILVANTPGLRSYARVAIKRIQQPPR